MVKVAGLLLLISNERLDSRVLRSVYNDINYLSFPMIQPWLQIHQDTLKYLRIGRLSSRTKDSLLDARKFPNLEHLHLPRWLMSSNLNLAEDDADLLLGPKLRKFTWDFSPFHKVLRERWTDFNHEEEEWVRRLAQTAISRGHSLEEVWIEFTPRVMDKEGEIYPWDRLDRLHEDVQSSGLKVKYNKPVHSRDKWKEEVARQRERPG
ncbi:hypothetical protein TMatcc_009547 [Talaromyces marneffei ATCC 18224]|uniref:uncharacterized protein n=1 Tax=Talaromyces marneffei TaxID=37727 RepID=UPI0012A98815|nr:uncharacterized protein EYB26_008797 [Talaromyces marneffei]KAE8547734.1 hypothetical protein EYB25_009527 [Talaromyces marneffei]QGA21087.1 hypothetical protein EYB26_008797 [Talaromyces marneffei]